MIKRILNEQANVLEKRLLSEKEAQVYIGLGRTSTRKLCKEIGAIIHVGARILYDRNVIDNYLNGLHESENADK